MLNYKQSDGFRLIVESKKYRNGIRTKDAGVLESRTRYGLGKLSEALYLSANACAERHVQTIIAEDGGIGMV